MFTIAIYIPDSDYPDRDSHKCENLRKFVFDQFKSKYPNHEVIVIKNKNKFKIRTDDIDNELNIIKLYNSIDDIYKWDD